MLIRKIHNILDKRLAGVFRLLKAPGLFGLPGELLFQHGVLLEKKKIETDACSQPGHAEQQQQFPWGLRGIRLRRGGVCFRSYFFLFDRLGIHRIHEGSLPGGTGRRFLGRGRRRGGIHPVFLKHAENGRLFLSINGKITDKIPNDGFDLGKLGLAILLIKTPQFVLENGLLEDKK